MHFKQGRSCMIECKGVLKMLICIVDMCYDVMPILEVR